MKGKFEAQLPGQLQEGIYTITVTYNSNNGFNGHTLVLKYPIRNSSLIEKAIDSANASKRANHETQLANEGLTDLTENSFKDLDGLFKAALNHGITNRFILLNSSMGETYFDRVYGQEHNK